MRISLLANAALLPILQPLRAISPHETELTVLSEFPAQARRQLRAAAETACRCDALLLLDGADLLPESGWRNGEIPLVVPRVHNAASLLLGGDGEFRRLFTLYDGGLCFFPPGARRELCCGPQADCQALCALLATQLDLPDGLEARAIARYNGWDYFERDCDFSLLESLLGGQWPHSDALVFSPGETVCA